MPQCGKECSRQSEYGGNSQDERCRSRHGNIAGNEVYRHIYEQHRSRAEIAVQLAVVVCPVPEIACAAELFAAFVIVVRVIERGKGGRVKGNIEVGLPLDEGIEKLAVFVVFRHWLGERVFVKADRLHG